MKMLNSSFLSFFLCLFYLSLSFETLKAEPADKILHPILNDYLTYISHRKGIQNISLGHSHSLTLTKEGDVYSWGYNKEGQLGLGSAEDRHTPTLITYFGENSISVTQISAGDKHNLAVDKNGKIYSWGDNTYGQLGLGDTEVRYVPEEITFFADKNITHISLGKSHSLALDNKGQVYSWGWNKGGQLGLGDKKDRYEPSLIPYFKEKGFFITQVATGGGHNLALDKNNNVYSWGENQSGQLGLSHCEEKLIPTLIPYFKSNGILISKLAIGSWHNLVLDDKGNIYTWGKDRWRLGSFDIENEKVPNLIKYFKNARQVLTESSMKFSDVHENHAGSESHDAIVIKDIASGTDHNLILDKDGLVYAWGCNINGELGLPNQIEGKARTFFMDIPVLIAIPKDKNITDIFIGSYYSMLRDHKGDIYVFGQNNYGQLGLGEPNIDQIEFMAKKGHAHFQYKLAFKYEEGISEGLQDHGKTYIWYKKAAEQGNKEAQFSLATMYEKGQGVVQDNKEAIYWYEKSAEQGHAKAQFNLALIYEKGQGVQKDHEKAFEWYIKAAEQGNKEAQFSLATMYGKGQEVSRNYYKAFHWCITYAKQGDKDAQNNLGFMYVKGRGVLQDYNKAFEWYEKSAEQGQADAQYSLGLMYEKGQGVQKDHEKAFEWYIKSAEQDQEDAQYRLGLMYEKGRGVFKDYNKAFEWYEKAADQGAANAQFSLAIMYDQGLGVQKDYEKSFYWYEKAAEQGHIESQEKLKDISNLSSLYDPYLIYVTKKLKKDLSELTHLGAFHQKLEDAVVRELIEEVKNSNEFENIINNIIQENKNLNGQREE